MKRLVVVVALVAVGWLVATQLLGHREAAAELPRGAREAAGPRAAEPLVPADELAAPAAEAPREEVVVAPAGPGAPAAAEPPPAEAAVPPEVDRGRMAVFVVRVEDRFGAPIHGARVRATGLRTQRNRGDFYLWPGEPAVDETDTRGEAELEHRVWMGSGGDWLDVADLCFRVEHPDYIAVDEEAEVADGRATVVLRQGAFLIVSGWIDSPAERIADVVARVSHPVGTTAADWLPVADGRPSCSRIPPGEHALLLWHERDGVRYTSEVTPFELVEGGHEELHLRLLPPRSLAGRLDPAVPRPVLDGEVRLNLYFEREDSEAVFSREHTVPVAEDGSFHFESLPPGAGEMIGLCQGWVSRRVPRADADPDQELTDWDWRPQQVPAEPDGPFVLAMERTAALEVTVLGPTGAPLEGAEVHTWPNVTWSIGWSDFFLDRTWSATTDARGVARIEDLPPRADETLLVVHPGLRMPLDAERERRNAWVDLAPGETARLTVQMEEGEEE